MNLQVIKSIKGEEEYVLLPMKAYKSLKPSIDKILMQDYERFELEDYIENPVALARIKANLTQAELAERMGVSQAYISKLESQEAVSARVMAKIVEAIA